jgi:hypothetical protein
MEKMSDMAVRGKDRESKRGNRESKGTERER